MTALERVPSAAESICQSAIGQARYAVTYLDYQHMTKEGAVDLLRMRNVIGEEDFRKYVQLSRFLRANR